MVAHTAIGIDAAGAGAGILAPLVLTRPVRGTVVVDNTLRATVGRGALHARQAGAVTAVAHNPGRVGVRPTGVGVAGVIRNYRLDSWTGKINVLNFPKWCLSCFLKGIPRYRYQSVYL